MNIAERLQKIADLEHLSNRAFELSIGKSSGYINMMKTNKGNPSLDVVQKIIRNYPKYNLNWLVTGAGNMFNSGETVSILAEEASEYTNGKSDSIEKTFRKIIREENNISNSALEEKLDVIIALLDIERELKD